jgi:hypothetical protein
VRRAQRQDLAQAPFQQRVVAGLRLRHAIAMAEGQGALADALEHDRIEPALGHQVHGRIEPVGREAGPRGEAEMVTVRHSASLIDVIGGGQPLAD